jgi:hypothetical protein
LRKILLAPDLPDRNYCPPGLKVCTCLAFVATLQPGWRSSEASATQPAALRCHCPWTGWTSTYEEIYLVLAAKVTEHGSSYSVCSAIAKGTVHALWLQEQREREREWLGKRTTFILLRTCCCCWWCRRPAGRPAGQRSVPDRAHRGTSSVNRSRYPRSPAQVVSAVVSIHFRIRLSCDVIATACTTPAWRGTKCTELAQLFYSSSPPPLVLPPFLAKYSPASGRFNDHEIRLYFFLQTRWLLFSLYDSVTHCARADLRRGGWDLHKHTSVRLCVSVIAVDWRFPKCAPRVLRDP